MSAWRDGTGGGTRQWQRECWDYYDAPVGPAHLPQSPHPRAPGSTEALAAEGRGWPIWGLDLALYVERRVGLGFGSGSQRGLRGIDGKIDGVGTVPALTRPRDYSSVTRSELGTPERLVTSATDNFA